MLGFLGQQGDEPYEHEQQHDRGPVQQRKH